MPVTNDELVSAILAPMNEIMDREGITPSYLARKLKRELNAKETKVFKSTDKESGEDVIYSKPMIAWDIRQKARMDAQKLLGLYPAEKHEHQVDTQLNVTLTFVEAVKNGPEG